jgi:hypothetical protein
MAEHDDMGNESIETLLELQRRWHSLLAERLEEYLLVASPGEEREATRAAYRATVEDHQALRLVLEEFAAHPALALPRRWEHIMIADAAGISGPFSRTRDAAAAGAMLVADLRPEPPPAQTPRSRLNGEPLRAAWPGPEGGAR